MDSRMKLKVILVISLFVHDANRERLEKRGGLNHTYSEVTASVLPSLLEKLELRKKAFQLEGGTFVAAVEQTLVVKTNGIIGFTEIFLL